MTSIRHLLWIPAGAGIGFLAAYALGDLLTLPVDLYYLAYFAIVWLFLGTYATRTGLRPLAWARRRLVPGLVLGLLGGLVLVRGVLAQPGTAPLSGVHLAWALLWRGLVYGAVDGLLLIAFPWVVAWRALEAERGGAGRRLGAGGVALLGVFLVTTAYHLGYRDFRSARVLQPNVGAAIGALPTVIAANPVAGPLAHVLLHLSAVLHAPGTDLYLPPHRQPDGSLRPDGA